MDIRYMGFEQEKNARAYRFDVVVKGQPNKRCVVTADLELFLRNRVALQEGPTLSANKLTTDLEANVDGEHQLTDQDLRQQTEARLQAEATRAEKRGGRRPPAATPGAQQQRSHWRNFGL